MERPPESRPNPALSDRSRPVTSRTQSVEVLELLAQPLFDVSLDHTADQPGHLDLAGQGDRAAVAVGLDFEDGRRLTSTVHPPLDQPPASYYLRPIANSNLFELMYYDGDRSIVVAEDLTGVRFERDHDSIKITLLLEEEKDGVMIERTEVRTVLLHIE